MGRKGIGKVRKRGVFVWYHYEAYEIEGFVFANQCGDGEVAKIAVRKAVKASACYRWPKDRVSNG